MMLKQTSLFWKSVFAFLFVLTLKLVNSYECQAQDVARKNGMSRRHHRLLSRGVCPCPQCRQSREYENFSGTRNQFHFRDESNFWSPSGEIFNFGDQKPGLPAASQFGSPTTTNLDSLTNSEFAAPQEVSPMIDFTQPPATNFASPTVQQTPIPQSATPGESEFSLSGFSSNDANSADFDVAFEPLTLDPNMVGDLGPAFSSNSRIPIARLNIGSNFPAANTVIQGGTQPISGSISGSQAIIVAEGSLTENIEQLRDRIMPTASPGNVLNGLSNNTALVDGSNEFTTVDSANAVDAQLSSTPGVDFDIIRVDRPRSSLDDLAQSTLQQATGQQGTAVYQSDVSALFNGFFDSLQDVNAQGAQWGVVQTYDYFITASIASPGAGGNVGRVKLADNNSAVPQNRIIGDFNYFDNVSLFEQTDVRRFTPGIEKTFRSPLTGGVSSILVQVPMAITLNSSVIQGGPNDTSFSELGNVQLATKTLLYSSNRFVSSAGIGVTLPTADDFNLQLSDGTQLISVDNEAVHVTPYLAFLYKPTQRSWAHCFFSTRF